MASIDNPAYLEKSYWWAEVAGCFFSLGKLTWSEHCYRQAAALGEEHVPVKFLLGDVLLYKGYFTDAAKAIKSYLAGVTIKRSDAILKCWLANELSNMFDRVDRHIGEAVSLVEEAIQDKSDPFYIQIIENAIRLDPLCGAAWYRLSVHGLPNWGNQSYECWLITAILLGDNITAWAFSILSFINETPSETLKKDEFVLAIITEAVQKHGVKLEQELFKITLDSKLLETVREVSEFGQHYFQVDLGFQLRQF